MQKLDLVEFDKAVHKAIPSLSRHSRDRLREQVRTVVIGGRYFAKKVDVEALVAGIAKELEVA